MSSSSEPRLHHARRLLDDFAERTGLTGTGGDPGRRYLWTDAFAVQSCFGLAHALQEPTYSQLALRLIELVHEHLGRFHPRDEREGRISGLPEAEARKHPTAGGLRIDKPATERPAGVPLDQRLEWDRDGQYFHYLTRWFNALLRAAEETGDEQYAQWAAELILAGKKFLSQSDGQPQLYWKMSTDLSRPLVPSMGAHDPLEGLICSLSAKKAFPAMAERLQPLIQSFTTICVGRHWTTSDPLGIGGLLLSTLRSAQLSQAGIALPASIHPRKLWTESLTSLQYFAAQQQPAPAPHHRLAFRECGLTLGLRALYHAGPLPAPATLDPLELFLPLATQIEDFWLDPKHQQVPAWTDHLDINAVTLAGSVIAGKVETAFA